MCHTAKEPAGYGYHGAYGPSKTPLSRLVRTVNTRWAVEENLDLTKGKVGLDQYEVRRWDAWHRHITLSLLAHAALQVTRAHADGN
jgi:SRSO17 transposase